tara:strand:- start:248 stop:481 length:234 start_codon:yes stop_codon:yes gene_type:complete
VPIKINSGTANKVILFIIPNILIGMLLKIVGSKIPKGIHNKANNIETPARVNATGYPIKSAAHIKISRRRGISSIYF